MGHLLVWQLCDCFSLDLAYAHFFPGDFTKNAGRKPGTDFVQIAATLTF